MHPKEVRLPRDLHRRVQPTPEAVDEILLGEPFDDPEPDPRLAIDVDHYLYGVRRRPRRRP